MTTTETKIPARKQELQKSKSTLLNGDFLTNGNVVEEQPFFNPQRVAANNNSKKPFFNPPTIQTKLKIGQPGDKYEQEADSMADKVVQKMNNPESDKSARKEFENSSSSIQRKPAFESDSDIGTSVRKKSSVESRLKSSKGQGRLLQDDTRKQMETNFNTDFSDVRIHTGSQAIELNQDLNAQAFAHGSDIYFNRDKYNTESKSGKHLLAHELTHTIQQSATKKTDLHRVERQIQKIPLDTPNINKLRELLKDDNEDEAIRQIGKLTDEEKDAVLNSREFKDLAISAFGNDEMFRAMKAMNRNLYKSLEWMFDEGTDYDLVKEIIKQVPSGSDSVRTDSWMMKQFVGICNNKEMAEAVDLLGGTLKQKLTWMKEEGSDWKLVKAKITATADAAEKIDLYNSKEMKDFFVDVCNNKEMAEAVDLLGGTLKQKLTWMKEEGSDWKLVKAKITATADAAEKTDLYNSAEMKDFFVDVCNNKEMAEAVDLLGGTLKQRLTWMKEEGSDWKLVKAKITATADAAEKIDLYNSKEMKDFFVDVCNNKEMAEAVDLLGGTLKQKLTWMKEEGSDWKLVEAKIIATADAAEKTDLYNSAEMKDFFVDICDNETIVIATRLLGGTWAQKLAWMNAEGVVEPVAEEMESMLGDKAKWTPSGPSSTNTFANWAKAPAETKAPPLKSTTTINCWEMVLLAAFRSKVIDWNWIHNLYISVPYSGWPAKLAPVRNPYVSGTTILSKGDIVFFNDMSHVALATGDGEKVYTFWPPPEIHLNPLTGGYTTTIDKVKISTLPALKNFMITELGMAAVNITYGRPGW